MTDGVLRFESDEAFEEGVVFRHVESGKLMVSVREEQAVDSYNEMFDCAFHMTPEQARQLALWILERF